MHTESKEVPLTRKFVIQFPDSPSTQQLEEEWKSYLEHEGHKHKRHGDHADEGAAFKVLKATIKMSGSDNLLDAEAEDHGPCTTRVNTLEGQSPDATIEWQTSQCTIDVGAVAQGGGGVNTEVHSVQRDAVGRVVVEDGLTRFPRALDSHRTVLDVQGHEAAVADITPSRTNSHAGEDAVVHRVTGAGEGETEEIGGESGGVEDGPIKLKNGLEVLHHYHLTVCMCMLVHECV